MPKLHRETTMLKPLPTIPQGKILDDRGKWKNTGIMEENLIKNSSHNNSQV